MLLASDNLLVRLQVRWPVRLALAVSLLLAVAVTAATPGVARGAAFRRGDVFMFASGGVQEYSPSGQLQQTIAIPPQAAFPIAGCFDPSGDHLILPGNGLFDSSGNALPSNWTTVQGGFPARCVADGLGNVYVSSVSYPNVTITKYDLVGNVLRTFTFPYPALAPLAIDLAPDECTLHYGSYVGLAQMASLNVCTDTQGTPFGPFFVDDVRVLPNFDLLTVDDFGAALTDPSGNLVQAYSPGATGFATYRTASLDPDGTSFWLCCAPPNPVTAQSPSDVYRLDLASGTVLSQWPSPGGLLGAYAPPLVGDANVEGTVDSDSPGTAEAFRATAGFSGQMTRLHVYIDSSSTARSVDVGVYPDRNGHPGALREQATVSNPRPGSWNYVDVPSMPVTAGQRYWIAVLAPKRGGTISFRDAHAGGRSETSAQRNLGALPDHWSGAAHAAGAGHLSAYGS